MRKFFGIFVVLTMLLCFQCFAADSQKPGLNVVTGSLFDGVDTVYACKVEYDLNGGQGVAQNEFFYATQGTIYTLLNKGVEVEKDGFVFMGWGLTADTAVNDVVTEITVGTETTYKLYAIWQDEATAPNRYTIRLYDGNELREGYIVNAGETLLLPSGEYTNDKFLLGWATEDGNFLAGYRLLNISQNMSLYAVWADKVKGPGANVVANGDFEGNGIDLRPSNGNLEIVTEADGNHVLKYTRGSAYASIQHHVNWEPGRPYELSFKVKTGKGTSTIDVNPIYNFADHSGAAGTATSDEWLTVNKTIVLNDSVIYEIDTNAISIYGNPMSDADDEKGVLYFDDISFTPHTKVTYDLCGGQSGPSPEYFVGDKHTLSQVYPVRKRHNFVGWALNPGSTTTVSEVSVVDGEDITVYAIWEAVSLGETISYGFTTDKKGVADGVITVVLPEDLAGYTDVEFYLADNNGILDGYSKFGFATLDEGFASYRISGNRTFTKDATRIAVVFKAHGKDSVYYWYNIPQEKLLDSASKPLYTFWVGSDLHCDLYTNNPDYFYMGNIAVRQNIWGNGSKDGVLFEKENGKYVADFVVLNGDLIDLGYDQRYFDTLELLLDARFNKHGIPTFTTVGNHEFFNSDYRMGGYLADSLISTFTGQLSYIENKYGDEYTIYRDAQNPDALYYAVSYKGSMFIYGSAPDMDEVGNSSGYSYKISDGQLKFIEDMLALGARSGKTSFLFTHVHIDGTVLDDANSISNSDEVKAILAKYPNTVCFSAHSHSNITLDENTIAAVPGVKELHYTLVGDMTSEPSYSNNGSFAFLSKFPDTNASSYPTSTLTAQFVEVYDDCIVIKGKQFTQNSDSFIGNAIYLIELPKEETGPDVIYEAELGDVTGEYDTFAVEFEKDVVGAVAVAAYDVDGKVIAADTITEVTVDDTAVLQVKVAKLLNAAYIRVFAFENLDNVKPLCNYVEFVLK